MRLIHTIHSPSDIKSMSSDDLQELAGEIREALLVKLSQCGGHVASNFGLVEATIVMHYVFDSPTDKIVFDTSHQTYTHKILTGRAKAFLEEAHYADVTGYSSPQESVHDFFTIGHTSTSISLAMGLCKGRDLCGGTENIIAVIGDGSLSGGEAMEAMNCAGEYSGNLIIVVNDNERSIQENHGGIYKNLTLLRNTNGNAQNNWFTAQGLDYVYEENGHDIDALIRLFEKVKDTNTPIVVHIHTKKGKGYEYAEKSPEEWHYRPPFELETGNNILGGRKTYPDVTAEFLLKKAAEIPELAVLTAGSCAVMGLTPERRKILGNQYVDSGIAEEHTAALASGIARRGGIPIWGTLGTFFQRIYDQLMQDIALNKASVILLFFGCGAYTASDITHTCLYDIAMLSAIPGIDYFAPTCLDEYEAMLEWFIHNIHASNKPVAIRVPGINVWRGKCEQDIDYSSLYRFRVEQKGEGIAILAVGNFFSRGEGVADCIKSYGIKPTLINPRYVSGLDENLLEELKVNHKLVLTLEDGIVDGGFGEKVARYYGDSLIKVLVRGCKRKFYDYRELDDYLTENRLQVEQIVEDIMDIWKNS